MSTEIVRELVDGEWVTTVAAGGGGGGGISEITSTDMSVTVTDPTGPTVDLSASGGSQPAWEAVTVPTDEASWTEYTGSGNWNFTDGVITFTNAGSGNSPVILTNVDHFGQAWAVECDLMVADHTSYQAAFTAAAWIYQAEITQELDGTGFQAKSSGPTIDSVLYGQGSSPQNTSGLPDESWHTIRAVNLPLVQQIYFDGTLVSQAFEPPTAFAPDGLKESRFLLYTSVAFSGTAFRNLKAWRIPLPTFPA